MCVTPDNSKEAITHFKVLERFNKFVDPCVPIPELITELTGITDDMLKGADKIEVVMPQFLSFVGDSVLVAHNADFRN